MEQFQLGSPIVFCRLNNSLPHIHLRQVYISLFKFYKTPSISLSVTGSGLTPRPASSTHPKTPADGVGKER